MGRGRYSNRWLKEPPAPGSGEEHKYTYDARPLEQRITDRLAAMDPKDAARGFKLFPGVSRTDMVRRQETAQFEREELVRALQAVPHGPERHELIARHAVRAATQGGLKCGTCFQAIGACWCHAMKRVSLAKGCRVVIYMATSEYGKNCNSGHAVHATLGDAGCDVVVAGIPEQEEALWERLRTPGAAVLYPDAGALTARQFCERMAQRRLERRRARAGPQGPPASAQGGARGVARADAGGAAATSIGGDFEDGAGAGAGGDPGGCCPVIDGVSIDDEAAPLLHTLVAIDATWHRSKPLMRRIPSDITTEVCPHVMLSALPLAAATEGHQHTNIQGKLCERSLLAPLRKNKCPLGSTRVCTLEAVAAFLTELGEGQHVADALHHNLRWRVDSSLAQKGRRRVYGTGAAAEAAGSPGAQPRAAECAVEPAAASGRTSGVGRRPPAAAGADQRGGAGARATGGRFDAGVDDLAAAAAGASLVDSAER